jgi:hypothetical protein
MRLEGDVEVTSGANHKEEELVFKRFNRLQFFRAINAMSYCGIFSFQ